MLSCFEPTRSKGHKPNIQNLPFTVGDADYMAESAIAVAEHRNVYIPLHLASNRIGRNERGVWNDKECNVEWVFGVGVDEDAGTTFARPSNLRPSFEIQTSDQNKQALYLFTRALAPGDAKGFLTLRPNISAEIPARVVGLVSGVCRARLIILTTGK